MKIAVVGAGSIAQRHIQNLITLGFPSSDIVVVDPRSDRRDECRTKFGVSELYEAIDQISFADLDAALICSPTALHKDHALHLAREGVHLLIEKPLFHSLEGIEELQKIVSEKNLKILIAYCFRFSEHGRKLKEVVDSQLVGRPLYVYGEFSEYLPDWHPYEDYRSFYMAKKSLGGGSLLDQSHIVDIAHWCFGEVQEVFGFNGRVSDLEVETDDIAEMQVRFRSGLVGTIHQDMFGRKHSKFMEIKCSRGNIFWDVYNLSVNVFNKENQKTDQFHFGNDHQVMYLNELKHFIGLCQGEETTPLCSLQDGIHGMKIIDALLRSQQSLRLEKVL
jgi:predicted dehydrogenase